RPARRRGWWGCTPSARGPATPAASSAPPSTGCARSRRSWRGMPAWRSRARHSGDLAELAIHVEHYPGPGIDVGLAVVAQPADLAEAQNQPLQVPATLGRRPGVGPAAHLDEGHRHRLVGQAAGGEQRRRDPLDRRHLQPRLLADLAPDGLLDGLALVDEPG